MWHYLDNDGQHGPFSVDEVIDLIHQNLIRPDTLVWTELQDDWRPAKNSDLAKCFPPPLPVATGVSTPKQTTGNQISHKTNRIALVLLVCGVVAILAGWGMWRYRKHRGEVYAAYLASPEGIAETARHEAELATLIRMHSAGSSTPTPDPADGIWQEYRQITAPRSVKRLEDSLSKELRRIGAVRPILDSARARNDLSVSEYVRRGETQKKLLDDIRRSAELRAAVKSKPISSGELEARMGFSRLVYFQDIARFAALPGAGRESPIQDTSEQSSASPPSSPTGSGNDASSANLPRNRPSLLYGSSPGGGTRPGGLVNVEQILWSLLLAHSKQTSVSEVIKDPAQFRGPSEQVPLVHLVGDFGERKRATGASFLTFTIRDGWKSFEVWINVRLADDDIRGLYGGSCLPFSTSLGELTNQPDDWSRKIEVVGTIDTNPKGEPTLSLFMYRFQ